jgi:hypothetical protein
VFRKHKATDEEPPESCNSSLVLQVLSEAHHKQIFVVVVADEHIFPAAVWNPGRPSHFGQSTHHDALYRAGKQKGQFPNAGGKGGESLLQQDSQLWLAGLQALCNRYSTTIMLVDGLRRLRNMRASEEWRPEGRDTDKDNGYIRGYVMYTHSPLYNLSFFIARAERQVVDLQHLHLRQIIHAIRNG